MIDLDNEAGLRAGDPDGMLRLAAELPAHCRDGLANGLGATGLPAVRVSNVVFAGMGGSAIAGDVLRALYGSRIDIPIVVVRDARLPAFCGPQTLVIASSYSGGTAEVLSCFEDAVSRGCPTVAVTSGGELAERASAAGGGLVTVPGGLMPRAAFGYLAFGTIGSLAAIGLVPAPDRTFDEALDELEAVAETLAPSVPTTVNEAKQVSSTIGLRVPVIWGAETLGAVAASRWKTQCNENGKSPAFASALPELDHNEVVGWSEREGDRFAVIVLRYDGEAPDVAIRFAPSIEIAEASGAVVREVWARGGTDLARFLSLVMIGDHASTYLGLARGYDPSPVDAIARLKQALADA